MKSAIRIPFVDLLQEISVWFAMTTLEYEAAAN